MKVFIEPMQAQRLLLGVGAILLSLIFIVVAVIEEIFTEGSEA